MSGDGCLGLHLGIWKAVRIIFCQNLTSYFLPVPAFYHHDPWLFGKAVKLNS
jgi:hypothetical protein